MRWRIAVYRNKKRPVDYRKGSKAEMLLLFDTWKDGLLPGETVTLREGEEEIDRFSNQSLPWIGK